MLDKTCQQNPNKWENSLWGRTTHSWDVLVNFFEKLSNAKKLELYLFLQWMRWKSSR